VGTFLLGGGLLKEKKTPCPHGRRGRKTGGSAGKKRPRPCHFQRKKPFKKKEATSVPIFEEGFGRVEKSTGQNKEGKESFFIREEYLKKRESIRNYHGGLCRPGKEDDP